MYRKYLKRLLDIVLALVAMPFLLLLIIVLAPVIWLEDRGPVFYCAPRLGLGGKTFPMYKLRSMYMNSPDLRNEDGSTYNGQNDPRVTKIGKFIRKTSFDELPQIINVLKGDMGLVGPRPNLVTKTYGELSEIEQKRLAVRPGITGYNQAYYRNSIASEQRYQHDLIYIKNISFLLDMKIIFRTVLSVLRRENIYIRQSQTNPSEALTAGEGKKG